MQLLCQQCGTSFTVEDALVAPDGGSVPCSRCGKAVAAGWPDLELDVEPRNVEPPPAHREARPAPESTGRPASAPREVRSIEPSSMRPRARRQAMVLAGAAGLATLVALGLILRVGGSGTPPTMPNPLSAQVRAWRAAGQHATVPSVAVGVRQALDGLATGTETGLRKALVASRASVMLAPDDASAVAAYAMALALQSDLVEDDRLQVALGGATALVAHNPEGPARVRLEEARAALLLRLGKIDSARQSVDHATRIAPTSGWAQLLGAVALVSRRPEEAAQRLAAMAPNNVPSSQIALARGRALLTAGRVAGARDVWRACAEGARGSALCLRELSRLELALDHVTEAGDLLERLALQGEASVEDHLLAARIWGRLRRNAVRALEHLDAAMRIPDLAEMNRGRIAAERAAVLATAPMPVWRAEQEATAWLDEALQRAPDLAELLYGAAIFDERAGRVDVALDSLEAAQGLAPERPEVALRFGLALRTRAPAVAEKVVLTSIAESPDYVPLRLLRALMAYEVGAKVVALQAVNEGLRIDPRAYAARHQLSAFADPSAAHLELARLLGRLAQKDRNALMLAAAGMATYFSGDVPRAKRALATALKADPQAVGARLYRGLALADRGPLQRAALDLAVALRSDTRQPVVRLYQARLLLVRRLVAQARAIFEDLVAQNPLDVGARVGLANALADGGEVTPARDEALRVLSMRPDDAEALQLLLRTDRAVAQGEP